MYVSRKENRSSFFSTDTAIFFVSEAVLYQDYYKSNSQLFHKLKLSCVKPVKNKFFFARKVNADSNLGKVEKKFYKTQLICTFIA